MSYGFGMGAGLRALTAARIGMQTAGNNVANANTPGYSRQRVELSAAMPFALARGMQIGSGVDVSSITRLVDDGLERRLRLQTGLVASAAVDYSRLNELEGLLNEPDGGLSTGLAGFFGSVARLQTDPSDRALRGGVVQAGTELAQGFQLLSRRLGDLRGSTFDEVRGLVREANQIAASVADLNAQIISLEANGSAANDLRDTRAQHIKRLSELVDVNAVERSTGSLDLLVGGHLLVSGDRSSQLGVGKTAADQTRILVSGTNTGLNVREGRIAALLRQEQGELPAYDDRIDRLARNLILEINRHHTTGMPRSGPFRSLTSTYGAQDGDRDGQRGDELLSQAGFLFDVQDGAVFVSVSDLDTGRMERTRVEVNPNAMTLQDFADALSAIDHLTASVDPTGRLRVAADTGYGFDFSPRLNPQPDDLGTFGGSRPSVGSDASGPYDLSSQTFPVSFTVSTGTATTPTVTTVTLDTTDFQNLGSATTEELVAAINADLGAAGTAADVGGRLVIRSNSGGGTSELRLGNVGAGTALSALGLSSNVATGQDVGVEVTIEGAFTGDDNGTLVFVPEGDGQIGVTPNLRVRVLDQAGSLVTTVNVGAGYEPGKPIDLGNGVQVSFGAGDLSASTGDVFALDVLADSDTSDILAALGMNAFFLGSGASDIAVNPDLQANVDGFAAGLGLASGDAGNLARLMGLRDSDVGDLDENTVEDFWADVVGDIGFATAGAEQTLQTQDTLMQHLEAERESVSGVNIDEEMLDLVKYQQSFEAAARFLSTVQELTNTLINIGR
ncbi:MAG: flagellar hook-associated protein FlgK [Planctomycetota bacterium]